MKSVVAFLLLAVTFGLEGCAAAASGGCTYYTNFGVSPGSATADHSASAPGNQQKFTSVETPGGTGTGCAISALAKLAQPSWNNPDPLDISISSAKDETNGTAICTGATSGPVTLTATSTEVTTPQSVSVQLTCK